MHSTEAPGGRSAMRIASNSERPVSGIGRAVRIDGSAVRSLLPGRALCLALVFGLAFATVDGIRSFTDAQRDIALRAGLAAVQMAPREADLPRPEPVPGALEGLATLVTADDGTVVASSLPEVEAGETLDADSVPETYLWATNPIGAGFGAVAVALPRATVTLDVAGRAGIASLLAYAGLAILYRRRSTTAPAPAVRPVSDPEPQPIPASLEAAAKPDWLDDIPYGIAHWTEDGTLISANRPFIALLRLDPATIVPGISYATVSKRISGRIAARPVLDQSHRRVVDVEREDGSAVMLDERGCAAGGFITIVTETTERRIADKMLANIREEQKHLARRYHEEKIRAEAASRAKTSFLAHLSHDVRTPLNHIIGFADLMQMEAYGPLAARYRDYLTDIKTSGERLLAAFAQILEYAELEGGRKTLKSEPVDVAALLSDTLARHRDRARRGGIRLQLASATEATVMADRLGIERMLDNLLDNALRFTPRGGEVRLAAWTGDNGVVLEVTDTGVGIAEDTLEKLSQPFALSDATFTKTSDGAGLGLAIARTIAELSGGRLAIDSAAAVGTTVAVSLPLWEGETAAPTPVPAQPSSGAPRAAAA